MLVNGRADRTDVEIGERIGAVVREKRRALGMSPAELGQAISVRPQQAQKYERGYDRIAVSTLLCLAKKLGCDLMDLVPPEVR